MKRINEVTHQLREHLCKQEPSLLQAERQPDDALWWLLSICDFGPQTSIVAGVSTAWYLLLGGVFRLWTPDTLTTGQVLSLAAIVFVQCLFQIVCVKLLKLLYVNYTWLLALGRYLYRLFQREFPPQTPKLLDEKRNKLRAHRERLALSCPDSTLLDIIDVLLTQNE